MPTNIGQESYNRFYKFDEYSYNIAMYLMNNNEMIWKLLKYDDADAWNKPNLTFEEKGSLIYAGQSDGTPFKVFFDSGIPDVWTKESTIMRIYPYGIRPLNRTVSTSLVCFETYSHYRLNTLSNYKTRTVVIISEILKTLNGIEIDGGLGALFFDQSRDLGDKLLQSGSQPFKGYSVYMSTNIG